MGYIPAPARGSLTISNIEPKDTVDTAWWDTDAGQLGYFDGYEWIPVGEPHSGIYRSLALGRAIIDNGGEAVGIGNANVTGSQSVGIGNATIDNPGGDSPNAVAIGYAHVESDNALAIGNGAHVGPGNPNGLAIGNYADASGLSNAAAIGNYANAGGVNSLAEGNNANAAGLNALALGGDASAPYDYSVAIGPATAKAASTGIIGGIDSLEIDNYGGARPTSVILHSPNGTRYAVLISDAGILSVSDAP